MFNNLKLSDEVLRALEIKGFTVPTEIQKICIPLIVDGKDVVGRSKTGSGKTFAFGLPAIDKIDLALKGIQVLVVCPTRELALQVTDEIRKITEFKPGCAVVPIYGGANIERQIKALKNGKIVVGTPGRLMDHLRRKTLKLHNIKMVVLDEADEMLNMGFREDIECILKDAPSIRQTVMFSATMPQAIKTITREYMVEPQYIEIGDSNSTLEEIDQSYVRISKNGKKDAIVELFRRLSPERTIVFCNTKRMVDEIRKLLSDKGFEALALHGDMRQGERKRVMNDIKMHKVSTLIATDVAARGIDIDDVEYIINFDVPNDVEYYIHRIGRTARAGKSGKAITLVNTREQLDMIEQFKKLTKSNIKEHLMSETLTTFYDIKAKTSNDNERKPQPKGKTPAPNTEYRKKSEAKNATNFWQKRRAPKKQTSTK